MDMMPQNVLRIVKQLKLETLPKTVQHKEDSSNVASGKVIVGIFGISDFLIQDLNFLLVMLYNVHRWLASLKGHQATNLCNRPVI